MKKFAIITAASVSLLFLVMNFQMTITISGIVTDASNGQPMPGVTVLEKGTTNGTITDIDGYYTITVGSEESILVFSSVGYVSEEVKIKGRTTLNVQIEQEFLSLDEVVVIGYGTQARSSITGACAGVSIRSRSKSSAEYAPASFNYAVADFNTEGYSTIHENGFRDVKLNPLSTFSIDVDAASYANVRRFINYGQKPPIDAVRIEEMINYFNYEYKQPEGSVPFSINTEISECPWNKENRLLHIGLQGKNIATENLPPSNLVFLIDVSGSMSDVNKLPLLKKAFSLLVDQLREEDRVAIVVYAGASGLVLPSASGSEKEKILGALQKLEAGGSTAGAAGLALAYKVAEENFIEEGNNRIILATDGDFNVGQSSNAEMERLIEKERTKGIFISVLGFGMGNYKDDKMEIIADKGNGNYAYIDNILEAKKVFVNEFGGTLFTIAKDVKIQIEFNPRKVKEYRLVGYENRLLNEEDFDNDKIDAGELGSGHTVTALYEIVPVKNNKGTSDRLRYQTTSIEKETSNTDELVYIKLRYKKPDGIKSELIEAIVTDELIPLDRTSDNFRFSAAVAEYGMCLRSSEFKGTASYDDVLELAQNAKGSDKEGYRSEFIRMVQATEIIR